MSSRDRNSSKSDNIRVSDLPEFGTEKYRSSDEAVAQYLTAAIDKGEMGRLTDALDKLARSRGTGQVPANYALEALCQEADPSFAAIASVCEGLELRLVVQTSEQRQRAWQRMSFRLLLPMLV